MNSGVEGFIKDMSDLGFEPRSDSGLIVYSVEAADGPLVGNRVATGVGIEELNSWPVAPPHWMHFPVEVGFSQTNTQPSAKAGWLGHSRQISGWNDAPAGVAWASHVRAVLSEAQ